MKLSKQATLMTPMTTLRQLLPITKKSLTANNNRYDVYDKKLNTRKTNESLRGSMHTDKKALKLQRVKGWVYNGVSHTVVEQGVVASVTMITIDKEYWSWVSN